MTDLRQLAINCTVRKYAYRQSNAGIVVSFLVHHAEMPADLATADLGTSYMMALVEVDENDQPKEAPTQNIHAKPAPASDPHPPARAHKRWADMSSAQHSGILCNNVAFQAFLREKYPDAWKIQNEGAPEDKAAQMIYWLCNVTSRKDILPRTPAGAKWHEIVSDYWAWVAEPAVVA